MAFTIIDSPVGDLTLVSSDKTQALEGIYMSDHRHQPDLAQFGDRSSGTVVRNVFGETIDQLGEYFAGARHSFTIPTSAQGTPFQQTVWEQLTKIPYGATITYGILAERIGNPRAVRAVGLANGRNPFSIIVPCHRVIGASGSLTGYGGGIERKRFLLDLEARHLGS